MYWSFKSSLFGEYKTLILGDGDSDHEVISDLDIAR